MPSPSDAAKPLSKAQLRALATVMRNASGGADNFLALLFQAKDRNGGRIAGEELWHQIAREMSLLEAGPSAFRQQLKIVTGALILFAVAAMCLVRARLHGPPGF